MCHPGDTNPNYSGVFQKNQLLNSHDKNTLCYLFLSASSKKSYEFFKISSLDALFHMVQGQISSQISEMTWSCLGAVRQWKRPFE